MRPSGAIQRVASFTIPLLIYYVRISAKNQTWVILAGVAVFVLGVLYYEVYNAHGLWLDFQSAIKRFAAKNW